MDKHEAHDLLLASATALSDVLDMVSDAALALDPGAQPATD